MGRSSQFEIENVVMFGDLEMYLTLIISIYEGKTSRYISADLPHTYRYGSASLVFLFMVRSRRSGQRRQKLRSRRQNICVVLKQVRRQNWLRESGARR